MPSHDWCICIIFNTSAFKQVQRPTMTSLLTPSAHCDSLIHPLLQKAGLRLVEDDLELSILP